MKKPRFDLLMILLALVLALAMAATLWLDQQGESRHGYGALTPEQSGPITQSSVPSTQYCS